MRAILRKYFIPHAGNNFHPHMLHTKRALFYGGVFLVCKIILVVFVLALPSEVFMSADILTIESQKIALLTNKLRQQKNLPIVQTDHRLNAAAAAKADDMANKEYFSHTSPSGETVADFVRHSGYQFKVVGENLAIGFATAEEAMAAWRKSPAHYANLIDKDYIDLGVNMEIGKFQGESLVYMVQHFAAPIGSVVPAVSPKSVTAAQIGVESVVVPATIPVQPVIPATEVLAEKIKAVPAPPNAVFGRPFWDNPVEKYFGAKKVSSAANIFGLSKGMFLLASVFFVLVLCLNIFIEIKKQHPHVIMQTAGLVGLLAILFLV